EICFQSAFCEVSRREFLRESLFGHDKAIGFRKHIPSMWSRPAYDDLRIVQQHADWLLANKPSNFLVHPTRPDGHRTLIDQVREQFPGETLSIINRLDRETSGLVLISRHSEAASLLGKMTIARQIKKSYLTIACGRTPAAGTILSRLDRLINHGPSRIY